MTKQFTTCQERRASATAKRIREGVKPAPLFVPSKPVKGENVWL